MSEKNKRILLEGNAAISRGNYEGFLDLCTDNTEWEFVGEQILKGKQAVREYMAKTYVEPPKFNLTNIIAEGDYVTAIGEIELKNEQGRLTKYAYCDVWRFEEDQIAGLRGFVIAIDY